MRIIYAAAAVPIAVLVCLSAFAGYALGDLRQIPMHWNSSWVPTLFAPKWIGLSLLPVFSIITMPSLLFASYGKTDVRRIREIIVVGSILIAAHVFHLSLVRRYVLNL